MKPEAEARRERHDDIEKGGSGRLLLFTSIWRWEENYVCTVNQNASFYVQASIAIVKET